MRIFLAFLSTTAVVILLLPSCTKEIHEDVYEDIVIDDNQPPPYDGVSTVEINTYVNKLYVDLIGRSPSETELQQAAQQLRDGEFTDEAKQSVIVPLVESQAYYNRFFDVTTQKMLQGADSFQIAQEILTLEFAVDLVLSQGDTLIGYALQLEQTKLEALQDAKVEYRNGTININEFMRRMIMNQFYDQINMGSLNYVVACFENLFHRQPTEEETAAGVSMVNGESNQLFLIDGNDKGDFSNIVTTTLEFYEGLVVDTYINLLARPPVSAEMSTSAIELSDTRDLPALYMEIAKSEEYAGF